MADLPVLIEEVSEVKHQKEYPQTDINTENSFLKMDYEANNKSLNQLLNMEGPRIRKHH